jgi:hypothetical protein
MLKLTIVVILKALERVELWKSALKSVVGDGAMSSCFTLLPSFDPSSYESPEILAEAVGYVADLENAYNVQGMEDDL